MTEKKSSIMETLGEIRNEEYPEIPAELVKLIFQIESDNVENRSNANRQLEKLLESHIDEGV